MGLLSVFITGFFISGFVMYLVSGSLRQRHHNTLATSFQTAQGLWQNVLILLCLLLIYYYSYNKFSDN